MPAISKGGIESIAKRMPRYVEPQIIYTAAKASNKETRVGEEAGVDMNGSANEATNLRRLGK
ncbi:hypothetical protein GCM10027348_30580 [Hymenobacter tenuis]